MKFFLRICRKETYDNYLILNKFDSACKAVDVGSIPSPASISPFSGYFRVVSFCAEADGVLSAGKDMFSCQVFGSDDTGGAA